MPASRTRAAFGALALTLLLGVAAWARWPALVVGSGLTAADEPLVLLDAEITAEFGLARPLVFLVVARDGDIWTQVGLAKVAAVTRDVLAMPGVVATDVVSLASPNMRDVRIADGELEPTYLMGEVPRDATAIAALRRRVDEDPNYGGNLVSRDGAAALVAADFMPGVADDVIAASALALRARHEDAGTRIEVVGAPVMLPLARAAAGRGALQLALALLLGALVLILGLGAATAAVAASAALLCLVWTVGVLIAAGSVALPWSTYGVATAALLAGAVATLGAPLPLRWCLPLGGAALAAGLTTDAPARAVGLDLAVGLLLAFPAAVVARRIVGRTVAPEVVVAAPPARTPTWLRLACLGAIVLAWLGNTRVHASFGLAGYGERFLPQQARTGLDALRGHFPPPSTFVVRLRGAPGFVAEPAVLEALDAVEREVRGEPRVRSVQSLADIVKLVNRSFNDDDPAFYRIPGDRGLVSRYLTLAYSPGFRRFVDRSLARTALWVYADGDDPAGLGRVHASLAAALAEHPLAGVEIDPIAGDGALALRMAHLGWSVTSGMAMAVAVLAVGAALTGSPLRAVTEVVVGVSGALLVGSGLVGWLGLALDLVTLPIVGCAALLGGGFALLARDTRSLRPLAVQAVALAAAALPLALGSFGAARALVPLLAAPLAALAALVSVVKPRDPDGASARGRHVKP